MSINRPATYYDECYQTSEEYKLHYTESVYCNLWKRVVQLIPSELKLTELGCGVGQFAEMINDVCTPTAYYGYDFSTEAINQCKARCLDGFYFEVADLQETQFGTTHNIFIALEIFEHTDDYQIIKNLGLGKEIIFTVPDFNDVAHVRYFHSINEVVERYKNVIKFSHIEKFGSWFLAKGVTI